MNRRTGLLILPAAVFALLAGGAAASAGPFGWIFPSESQPNSYSPFRYWTPRLERVKDYFHGPKISVYAPDRHPEIPPTFSNLTFPCAAADPASTLIQRAPPPPTSKFKYLSGSGQ
jgi:hypothetical protein